MRARDLANTAEIARAAGHRAAPPRPARLPAECRRHLRVMPLRDGRANLVDDDGALFMPCASRAVAETMRAVFST